MYNFSHNIKSSRCRRVAVVCGLLPQQTLLVLQCANSNAFIASKSEPEKQNPGRNLILGFHQSDSIQFGGFYSSAKIRVPSRSYQQKMDKLKLGALGERLKTSGAQMGRMVSGKMKEMLQAPTPESKMVDEATSENLEEPNWSLNLRICSMLNSEEFNGTEIVKAIKKKIGGKNNVSQRLSLDLLETCAMNCEKVFSEIASEKVLEEMVKMIDNKEVDQNTRIRAFQLIRAWGESEDLAYLPAFRQTYGSLKEKAAQLAPFPAVHEAANSSQLIQSLESDVDQTRLSPPERYPMPMMDLHGTDDTNIFYHAGSLSVEEKKELLVTTRNTVELLSSMLNETELNPMKKDDLMLSMLEKCKHSQPEIQMMIESTSDDDGILFEALNLNDELQSVISKFEKMEAAMEPEMRLPPAVPDTTEVNLLGVEEVKMNPLVSDTTEVNLLGVEEFKIKPSDEAEKTTSPKGGQSSESKTTG